MDDCLQRRSRLVPLVREAGVDFLVVSHPLNVTYLTGFSGDSSWLLIGPTRTLMVSDGRYTVQLQEECPGLEVLIRRTEQTVVQAAAEALAQLGATKVGLEAGHVTLADLETLQAAAPSMSWAATKRMVESLRMIKDAGEIAKIRTAVTYAEKAYETFHAGLTATDTEKDLADSMDHYLRRAGAMGSSFPTIVAVGDHSALPHAPVTMRKVAEAPFLLLDWGASGACYKSDITRMIWHGSAYGYRRDVAVEDRLKKLYTIVLEAQSRALDAIRPGVTAGTVDAAVRACLEQHGYNQYFNHGLGHGIGLQIHEGPNIRGNSADVLQVGMVFTIEPGVYLPDFAGVRIEDDYLLTENGPEPLTHLPKHPDMVFRN